MQQNSLWWRDGVIYQIYPRSFYDTTGSGIGDLNGITEKIGYLSELGVDALWLSPINPSPDVDFGYDVADYRAIDPKFGSMADFDRLVATARKANIEIVLDLVLNHTSDQHAWFLNARSSRDNPFRDYYLWQDAGPDGKPPNNWQAVFGGRGWEWDEATRQYYYHMFYKEQPDVNWRNPKVRQEMLDVFRFWLDKGVRGFRLDVFNIYFKDALLRDNPLKPFGRRPFDRQIHLYDFDQPELMDVLGDIRAVLDGHQAAYAIGETFFSSPEKAARYCGDGLLHACFNFEVMEARRDPRLLMERIQQWQQALGDKWPNYVLNNHDTRRYASRFGQGEDDARLKVMAAMLLTLRGTPFLYYGEEIGMRDIRVRRKDILDPIGKRYWPIYPGRDGCRAPMQWDASPQSGFSRAKPWLPLHPNFRERNVAAQSQDTHSLFNFYKALLSLRRNQPALISGDFVPMQSGASAVMSYAREYAGQSLLVLLNFSAAPQTAALPPRREYAAALSSTQRPQGQTCAGQIALKGNEALILQEL
jgi:alpha-glucosidase